MTLVNPKARLAQKGTVVMLGKKKDFKEGKISEGFYQRPGADLHPKGQKTSAPTKRARWIDALVVDSKIPDAMLDDARIALTEVLQKFQEGGASVGLPSAPKRDYQPREDIIAYIKAEEGLGPWLNAGVLNRPMIRHMAPRAYTALANWLRKEGNSLEAVKINIPSKSDLVAQRQVDPTVVRAARRIVAQQQRTSH